MGESDTVGDGVSIERRERDTVSGVSTGSIVTHPITVTVIAYLGPGHSMDKYYRVREEGRGGENGRERVVRRVTIGKNPSMQTKHNLVGEEEERERGKGLGR